MPIQNAIRNSEKFQEQISGSFGGGTIPSPEKSRWSLMESPAAPLSAASNPITTNDSITTSDSGAENWFLGPPDIADGANLTISVTGVPGGHILRTWQGTLWIYPGRRITVKGTLLYSWQDQTSGAKYLVGICDTIGGGDPLTVGCVMVGLVKPSGALPGNWILFTSNVGIITSVDTQVPIVLGQRYSFQIVMNNGVVTLYINGIPVAGSKTNLPTNPLGINWYLQGIAAAGGTKTFATFEYLYAENSTP
jgi:hypothetical protein